MASSSDSGYEVVTSFFDLSPLSTSPGEVSTATSHPSSVGSSPSFTNAASFTTRFQAAAVNAEAVTTSSHGVVFLQTTDVGTLASGTARNGALSQAESFDVKSIVLISTLATLVGIFLLA